LEQETQAGHKTPLSREAAVALIKKIGSGDRSALAALYDKTSRLLFGLVLRILGDKTLAEETLLDIYTDIWKQSAAYDPGLLPLEWMLRIAHGRGIERLHSTKLVRRKRELSAGGRGPGMTVAPRQQELARSAIDALVPSQREILDWSYYSGFSCSEIAAQIGKPVGAVRTHARFGMSRLSESFRPMFEERSETQTPAEESH
jgi:RNA polymerase sigma-70 factor (ECF subfamily)